MAEEEHMRIRIRNCNNVDSCQLTLVKGALNVKFGQNGTGKTTIAKAIAYKANRDVEGLLSLRPFRLTESGAEESPSVSGGFRKLKVAVFNEQYVQRYVFLEDDLIGNSFEVFVKPLHYEEGMAEIEKLLCACRYELREGSELDHFDNSLKALIDCFGTPTKMNGCSAASVMAKGLFLGNKIDNIPEELEVYRPFFNRGDILVDWFKSWVDADGWINDEHVCPFCGQNLDSIQNRIERMRSWCDLKSIRNTKKTKDVFGDIMEYLAPSVRECVHRIFTNANPLNEQDKRKLFAIRDEAGEFHRVLSRVKELGCLRLENTKNIVSDLKAMEASLSSIQNFKSEKLEKLILQLRRSLEQLIKESVALKKALGVMHSSMLKTIGNNKKLINDFLETSGYNYSVSIEQRQDGTYKTCLKHTGDIEVQNVAQHLSFGERNALALALFVCGVIREKTGLIVLDDPISSFDGNKKFGLLDMMFLRARNECLRGRTVLLLTHDFGPVIDIMRTQRGRFGSPPHAWFLSNVSGKLNEREISCDDVKSFLQILRMNYGSAQDDLIKLIYLRRELDVMGRQGGAYSLISSLFHYRASPTWDKDGEKVMGAEEIKQAEQEILKIVPRFDYKELLCRIKNKNELRKLYDSLKSKYEKLQVFRLMFGNETKALDLVVRKFVNETYHVENDCLFQLNPREFDTIPAFVIRRLDAHMEKHKNAIVGGI